MKEASRAARGAKPAPRAALRVIVAGGGVAALEATLALRDLAEERVSIELLAPEPRFWYRPLAVVEPFGIGHVHGLELTELACHCGVDSILGALASVDADRHVARTAAGAEIEYDVLLLALGARPVEGVAGAFTFRGPADSGALGALVSELVTGSIRRLAFARPTGVAWPLPLYELTLLTAAYLAGHGDPDVELALVTPENAPLGLFGRSASSAISTLLEAQGVPVHLGRHPISVEDGELRLAPEGNIPVDRVVALPRLRGQPIGGIPRDQEGFVPIDRHGRVTGVDDVFAAGDLTSFPVKQGGLAAQQADAAAETIAAMAGVALDPQPFRPVLRGLLLTGAMPAYLRTELSGGTGDTSVAQTEPLWWPPGKIVGRYLAPFLAERGGLILRPPAEVDGVPVEVDLSSAFRTA